MTWDYKGGVYIPLYIQDIQEWAQTPYTHTYIYILLKGRYQTSFSVPATNPPSAPPAQVAFAQPCCSYRGKGVPAFWDVGTLRFPVISPKRWPRNCHLMVAGCQEKFWLVSNIPVWMTASLKPSFPMAHSINLKNRMHKVSCFSPWGLGHNGRTRKEGCKSGVWDVWMPFPCSKYSPGMLRLENSREFCKKKSVVSKVNHLQDDWWIETIIHVNVALCPLKGLMGIQPPFLLVSPLFAKRLQRR